MFHIQVIPLFLVLLQGQCNYHIGSVQGQNTEDFLHSEDVPSSLLSPLTKQLEVLLFFPPSFTH